MGFKLFCFFEGIWVLNLKLAHKRLELLEMLTSRVTNRLLASRVKNRLNELGCKRRMENTERWLHS